MPSSLCTLVPPQFSKEFTEHPPPSISCVRVDKDTFISFSLLIFKLLRLIFHFI